MIWLFERKKLTIFTFQYFQYWPLCEMLCNKLSHFYRKTTCELKRIRFEIWYLFCNIRRIFHLKPFQWEQFFPITKELEWNMCKLQAKMIIVIFFICLKCEIYIFNVIQTQTCFFFSCKVLSSWTVFIGLPLETRSARAPQ